MREIKFRAWLKNQNKMALVSEWNMWNLGHIFTVDECDFHDKTTGNANYRLMQYTGLKDKNGVEIYEGDILSNIEFSDEVYDSGRGTWDCGSYLLGDCNECSEIIGNKYENPELLK